MSGRGRRASGTMQAADALLADGFLDQAQHARVVADARAPWWLMLLQTLAAWVASLLILSSFMLPLAVVGDSAVARALAGALLCAAAIALFRRERLFTAQMALAFSLAGQALLVSASGPGWGAFFDGGRHWAAIGAGVAAAMMWPPSASLHRSLCAVLLAAHVGALIGDGPGMEAYAACLTAGVAVLWLARPRWAGTAHGGRVAALARGGTVAALALPVIVGLSGEDAARWLPGAGASFARSVDVLSIGAGLVFVAVAGALASAAGRRVGLSALAAALVLAIVSQPAPGLLVAASLALACFHGGHRGLAALALAAAVAYVGEYYYRLDTTLLLKSGLMALAGAVLLALRHALRAPRGKAPAVDAARGEASARAQSGRGERRVGGGLRLGVVMALALVVGVGVRAVIDREQVLERGRVVLLELAPVDPRSLMQGDYMALRFAIDDVLAHRERAPAGRPPRFAYLDVDAGGRARLAGVGDELSASATQVAVRIRMRDGAPSVGPNAFFFQEGQAEVFAGARWGELRVAADGTALLADLRDENLQRLGASRR